MRFLLIGYLALSAVRVNGRLQRNREKRSVGACLEHYGNSLPCFALHHQGCGFCRSECGHPILRRALDHGTLLPSKVLYPPPSKGIVPSKGSTKATTRVCSCSGQEFLWKYAGGQYIHYSTTVICKVNTFSLTQKFMIKVTVHAHTHKTQQMTLTN